MADGKTALAIGKLFMGIGKAASPKSVGLDFSGVAKGGSNDDDDTNNTTTEPPKTKPKEPSTEPQKDETGQNIYNRKRDELDSFDKALEHGTSYRSLERVANGDQSAFKNYPPE